ncbi:MAG: hypothetical protein IKP25_05215 [Ruminococcus sp.]|nr:hypothetical protein [Ruminococcus sp.]
MARMYTLDKKLLCGSPEIRVGEKVYPVDDRTKTVKKILKLFKSEGSDDADNTEEALKLAFGERYKEIEELDMPFAAYQELVELVIKAMTGEEPEKEQSFPEQ